MRQGYIAVAIVAVIATGILSNVPPSLSQEPPVSDNRAKTVVTSQEQLYSQLYANYSDSVVSIRVTDGSSDGGQGSGFVYDENGHIVTNQHVIGDAESVYVNFKDGEWKEAEVVGSDVYSDLAVLRISDIPAYTEPLEIARQEPLPGSIVVALGNPFGLQETVTHGIVSGVNRSMQTANNFIIPDTVQTDAPINPGNSGGPLVNAAGEVVGVNRAKRGDNIGFAISTTIMRQVIPELLTDGEYEHAYLGVSLRDVTPRVAEMNDLPFVKGVMVVSTIEDGPSDGVLEDSEVGRFSSGRIPVGGDVILAIDGRDIASSQQLSNYLATNTQAGDSITLTVWREGQRQQVSITLGERPQP